MLISGGEYVFDSLFIGQRDSACEDEFASLVLAGKFRDALVSREKNDILFGSQPQGSGNLEDLLGIISRGIDSYTTSNEKHSAEKVLFLGVAFLNAFIMDTYTGPASQIKIEELLPSGFCKNSEKILSDALLSISENGEDVQFVSEVLMLCYAKFIISHDALKCLDQGVVEWYMLRILFVQQRMLSGRAENLKKQIMDIISRMEGRLPFKSADSNAQFFLETSLVHLYYKDFEKFRECIKKASDILEFSWFFTGRVGRATRSQKFDVTYLSVGVNTPDNIQNASNTLDPKHAAQSMPKCVPFQDDNLLDKPISTYEVEDRKLRELEQCVLLSCCKEMEVSPVANILKNEEMLSIIQKAADDIRDWSIYSYTLYMRSKIEFSNRNKSERAALQIEALIDQFKCEDSAPKDRLAYFFSIPMPTIWELKTLLGEFMFGIGAIKSALDIFIQLQSWEKVILCHQTLGDLKEAERLVRESLEKNPNNPRMHCILGDITDKLSHYEKAWEISNQKYARAMHSLGKAYYNLGKYEMAIPCYQKALFLNPIIESSWFALGCCAIRTKTWDLAINSFKRTVSLEPTNSEAWCNLSSCHLQVGKPREALMCLKNALKNSYENKMMWENYLFVCMTLSEYQEAVTAMERIMEISTRSNNTSERTSESAGVDLRYLEFLVSLCNKEHNEELSSLKKRLGSFLDKATAHNIPEVLILAAKYWKAAKSYNKALGYHQRAHRTLMRSPNLTHSTFDFQKACESAISLSELAASYLDKKDLACQTLETLIERSRKAFSNTELHKELTVKLQEISAI